MTTSVRLGKIVKTVLLATVCCAFVLCAVCLSSCVTNLNRLTAEYTGGDITVGGSLNKDDITVTAHYGNGSSKTVTNFNVDKIYMSEIGTQVVTVTYKEGNVTKTATFAVTVAEASAPQITLESITAKYNGGNIAVGGTLNNGSMVVTAFYSDNSNRQVSNFTVGNFSSAHAGMCVVNVSYAENDVTKETTVSINIIDSAAELADYGKYGIMQQDGSVKITNTAIVNDELQMHFLAVTNNSPGDSVYVKAGDVDILIDAGSTTAASTSVPKYLKDNGFVTDNKIEFLIATHSDNDHIAGLAGSGDNNGILDKYEFDTIITYPRYYTDGKVDGQGTKTAVQTRFENKCQALAEKGVNVFTALQCYNESDDGAQRTYKLTDNIEMEILYNYYYDHTTSNNNNYSVCLMFNHYGSGYDFDNPSNPENKNYVNHFLFTGDLENEKGDAEAKLVEYNDLPNVVLFKGGHHGSATSSSEVLMNKIMPKTVCVCTCCGEGRYGFPTQEFINRVAPYTDLVFMTNENVSGKSSTPLNGNIVVTSNENGVFVNCSNNNTLFKDTDWFKNNRTCPDEWKSGNDGE